MYYMDKRLCLQAGNTQLPACHFYCISHLKKWTIPMLQKLLNSSPLLRPLGIPENPMEVCVICPKDMLERLVDLIEKYPKLHIKYIVLPELERKHPEMSLTIGKEKVEIGAIEDIAFFPELEKIFISPARQMLIAPYLSMTCRKLVEFGIENIYIFDMPPEHSLRPPHPHFYRNNSRKLEQAFSLLSGDADKKTFTGRLRAILCGNAGYIPIANHREYFHPRVQPEPGDFMLDGGVSDMVNAQIEFVNAVGEKGHIFGFEPIPGMAHKAGAQLKKYRNYSLQCAGLAENTGNAFFADLRDSSHIIEGNSSGVACDLTSIDDFCNKNHLPRVDCIKLDVEGAELSALKGARGIISRYTPKLIICLYHKPQDMYEIPIFIKELAPQYELFLGHSSCQFMDTVLYARVPRS